MRCEKCNKKVDTLKLSYNKKYGWLCESCAKETDTALNFFMKKKKEK